MIRRIRGLLSGVGEESVLIDVGGLCYEVYLPPHVRERFEGRPMGTEVELCTYYYLQQTDSSKSVPTLLGFETDTQREFFELLTDVPRMGPRAALRAFSLPVGTLARAIELNDLQLLRSLPGVGPQRAKDIVATLAGKLGRFVDAEDLADAQRQAERPLQECEVDAVDVLVQLGMGRADAVLAVRQAREDEPSLQTVDAIVRHVFQRR